MYSHRLHTLAQPVVGPARPLVELAGQAVPIPVHALCCDVSRRLGSRHPCSRGSGLPPERWRVERERTLLAVVEGSLVRRDRLDRSNPGRARCRRESLGAAPAARRPGDLSSDALDHTRNKGAARRRRWFAVPVSLSRWASSGRGSLLGVLLLDGWLSGMLGQRKQAGELYEQLLGYRNDLGLLSEQIDPGTKELMGNFSQALLHIGVLGSAINLARGKVPKEP
jgi:hypothetical protein